MPRLETEFEAWTTRVQISQSAAPAAAGLYLTEMKCLLITAHVVTAMDSDIDKFADQDESRRSPSVKAYITDVHEFIDCWNGEWWKEPVVYSSKPRQEVVNELRRTGKNILLRKAPIVASANKWGKLWKVIVGMLFIWSPHALIHTLLPRMKFKDTASPCADGDAEEALDAQLIADLSFSAMRGARFQASCGLFADRCRMRFLLILSIALECLSFLNHWWSQRGSDIDATRTCPPLLDMLHPPSSPLVATRQYVSTLIVCATGRLELVWRYGFDSYEQWCSEEPAELALCKRLLQTVDCSLYKRHCKEFGQPGVQVFRLADSRTTAEDIRTIKEEWDYGPPEHHAPGFARQARSDNVTGDMLMEDDWQAFLWNSARVYQAVVIDVEWMHGRESRRRDPNGQSDLAYRFAKGLNLESKRLNTCRQKKGNLSPRPAQRVCALQTKV